MYAFRGETLRDRLDELMGDLHKKKQSLLADRDRVKDDLAAGRRPKRTYEDKIVACGARWDVLDMVYSMVCDLTAQWDAEEFERNLAENEAKMLREHTY